MGKVLIAEKDEMSLSAMKEALKTHEVEVFSDMPTLMERLQKEPADLLVLDNAILDKEFGVWIEELKTNCPVEQNKTIKIMILSFDDSPKKVTYFLKLGAQDYMIKPVDRPLFMQKVGLLLADKTEKQVYTFQTATGIDYGRQVSMEEISEFGLTMRTTDAIKEGDVASFYSEVFKTEGKESILGRCYKVAQDPEKKEDTLASFMFVGVNQATLKQIRTWMKQEYIRKKQKAA